MKVSLLTGGCDKPYSMDLLSALIAKGVVVDLIGNDEMGTDEIVADKNVNFFNLRGNQNPDVSFYCKIMRVLKYYVKLLNYSRTTDSTIFHILWFNKFDLLDKILLNSYYKFILGKKLVFTAHNIDVKQRDGGNNIINKLSLRFMYNSVDHIFVHTIKMKSQLIDGFGITAAKISVIPFGTNKNTPASSLTKLQARAKLELNVEDKILLFFGNIAPYKGLEYLLYAMKQLKIKDGSYRLLIAGQIKGCQSYWDDMECIISKLGLNNDIVKNIRYIPDDEVGDFFKASDVLIIPYKFIFQSGVLFLSYSFGLPVIVSDVGSLREYIDDGNTGMICRPEDPKDMADTIIRYFNSNMYHKLEQNSKYIISYSNERYSWDEVGNITCDVYKKLLS